MSQEDDLRGLARVMDFMRALSILFVIINIYWYCYPAIKEWGINIGVVDKILLNFHRTAGLFTWSLYTKLFCVVFLALSCIGTKGVKEEKI
ncbi:YWFCY domain-containing protein, partial [Bacteroides uniformis]